MIGTLADEFSLDPLFLDALHNCFPPLKDASELTLCCVALAQRLAAYPSNPLARSPNGRLVYRPNFIAYFISTWKDYSDVAEMRETYNQCCNTYDSLIASA